MNAGPLLFLAAVPVTAQVLNVQDLNIRQIRGINRNKENARSMRR